MESFEIMPFQKMILRRLLLCFCLSLAVHIDLHAQSSSQKLYSLFIFSFAKSLHWPDADSKAEFKIGVFGDALLKNELQRGMMGKWVGTKKPEVVEIQSATEANDCQIVFVTKERTAELTQISIQYPDKAMLIISEGNGLTELGSAIDLYFEQGKLRFEFSLSSLEKRGIKIPGNLRSMGVQLN